MEVRYPQTILKKSSGLNPSEEHLAKLCDRTFLSLWSYPNIYKDQGKCGKEICDLLVIFDNHVFIFSDKMCEFGDTGDIQTDWSRWYKKAVKKSADQIWGAERWLQRYPDRVFLDRECKSPFPYPIPNKEDMIGHRIVVAHGASEACKKYYNGGSGSLMLTTEISGDMHVKTKEHDGIPFHIGLIDSRENYVHVFDDITLNVILKTVDTISDFTDYLTEKEEYILSGRHLFVSGEEELLAIYLQNINEDNKHTLLPRDMCDAPAICVLENKWIDFCNSKERKAQKKANEISYSWDELIETFLNHITTGTSWEMSHPDIDSQQKMFRIMARENRTQRRALSLNIYRLIGKSLDGNTHVGYYFEKDNLDSTFYLFLLLPKSNDMEYKEYREFRSLLLLNYLRIRRKEFPNHRYYIGIATEAGLDEIRSEDVQFIDNENYVEDNEDLKNIEKIINRNNKRNMYYQKILKYPINRSINNKLKGSDRNKPCPCGSGKKYKKCCGKN